MDRFDLEDKITAMHNTVEELNVLARMVLEQDMDKDDIANTIYGIKMLHEGRINDLFDTFTQVFKLDQYYDGCTSQLDLEADRNSVVSEKCCNTRNQPFESAPFTVDITTKLRQVDSSFLGTNNEDTYWACHDAANEINDLREAIRAITDQYATVSFCNGNITITMDATLTDNERRAIQNAIKYNKMWAKYQDDYYFKDTTYVNDIAALESLLERTEDNNG